MLPLTSQEECFDITKLGCDLSIYFSKKKNKIMQKAPNNIKVMSHCVTMRSLFKIWKDIQTDIIAEVCSL